MASEEMRAAAQVIREMGMFSGDVDVEAMRQSMADGAALAEIPDDVSRTDFDVDGVPACHIETPGARQDRGILYFHGGGYVMGSLDTHHELMGRLSRACRAPVFGIDYRLAPEHPYPAAVDDAVASYERMIVQGIEPANIVIAGDSAGGGLTLACMLALKAAGKPQPAGAVLISPWTDLSGSGASVQSRADVDPMVSPSLLEPMAALYRGDTAADDAGVSPLFADLTGLAPLFVQVGDHEILLDDSTRLVERAESVGVRAELQIFDEGYHVFQNNPGLPESAEALTSIAQFFDEVTA